jgi:hypothetical protein
MVRALGFHVTLWRGGCCIHLWNDRHVAQNEICGEDMHQVPHLVTCSWQVDTQRPLPDLQHHTLWRQVPGMP